MHFTFKNLVEFTQEFFFQSDNSHTQAHVFSQCDKKTGECN
jgi:hypothetical protein